MGSINFEVRQSSSMQAIGPQNSTVADELSPPLPRGSILSGPLFRKRLRDMDSGFDLLYDTKPLFVQATIRSPFSACPTEFLMHSSGMVSDSLCPPQSLGSLLRKHIRYRKKARCLAPSIMQAHAHTVTWPTREGSAQSLPQRRRRKLRHRSHNLLAGMGSVLGSTSRCRRGQASRPFNGSQRGDSITTGFLAQDIITSESSYDTGVSSPEGRGFCSESPQACSPSDMAQVTRLGSSLGFKHHCGVDCHGKSGSLWVGWNDDTLIEVCDQNANFIILQVHDTVQD
ncbi:hypothetical protein LOK49_LG09G00529 [Camellia lanceoleosa]|uniref:Uncharacterized protein n=1 Tax=Camellia lanceoleosa TaxID=1840588 RepID=A0ACC0GIY9_9ERIC|nr:hypothetical protein LOK49_LG09G00529 [Camellia lanceoleosa]